MLACHYHSDTEVLRAHELKNMQVYILHYMFLFTVVINYSITFPAPEQFWHLIVDGSCKVWAQLPLMETGSVLTRTPLAELRARAR